MTKYWNTTLSKLLGFKEPKFPSHQKLKITYPIKKNSLKTLQVLNYYIHFMRSMNDGKSVIWKHLLKEHFVRIIRDQFLTSVKI